MYLNDHGCEYEPHNTIKNLRSTGLKNTMYKNTEI